MDAEDIISAGLTAYIAYLVFQVASALVGAAMFGIFILVVWSLVVGC